MGFDEAFFITSWSIYNQFYQVLVDYGLIYLPLIVIWYKGYFKMLSDDKLNPLAIISEQFIRYSVIIFFVLYELFFIPFHGVGDIKRSTNQFIASSPAVTQTNNPQNQVVISKLESLVSTFNSQNTIKVPIVWSALEVSMRVLKDSLIGVIPKNSQELRQSMLNSRLTSEVKSPIVANVYSQFYQACFIPANNKFNKLVKSGSIITDHWFFKIFDSDIDKEEYDWPGGSFYLHHETGKGFYKECEITDTNCHDHNTTNATGFEVSYQTTKGTKTITEKKYCDEVWEKDVRLKLIAEFEIDKMRTVNRNRSVSKPEQDKILRNKLIISDFNPLGEADDVNIYTGGFLNSIVNLIQYAGLTIIANIAKVIVSFINFFIITALPLFQSFLLFFIVALLPFAIILSAFKIEILVGFIMLYFSVSMLNIVWALVGFLDKIILDVVYDINQGNDAIATVATTIMSHLSPTRIILDIMIAVAYFMVTAFWFNLMKSVGADAVDAASSGMSGLNSNVSGGLGQAPKAINPISKLIKK